MDEEELISKLYANERGAMLDYGVHVDKMLAVLENNLMMFSDDDQEFIQSMVLLVGTGSPLVAQQIQRLGGLMSTLKTSGHNTLGESLSMVQVVKDLAGALHTLNPSEKQFLIGVANKMKQRIPLSTDEVQQLLNVYAAKGF